MTSVLARTAEFATKVCITDVVMLAVKLELYLSSVQNPTLLTLHPRWKVS